MKDSESGLSVCVSLCLPAGLSVCLSVSETWNYIKKNTGTQNVRVEAAGLAMNSENKNVPIKLNEVHAGCINTTPFSLQRVTTSRFIRGEMNLKNIYRVFESECT